MSLPLGIMNLGGAVVNKSDLSQDISEHGQVRH